MAKHSKAERERRTAESARVAEIEAAWMGSVPTATAKAFTLLGRGRPRPRSRAPPTDMAPGTLPNPPRPGREPKPVKEDRGPAAAATDAGPRARAAAVDVEPERPPGRPARRLDELDEDAVAERGWMNATGPSAPRRGAVSMSSSPSISRRSSVSARFGDLEADVVEALALRRQEPGDAGRVVGRLDELDLRLADRRGTRSGRGRAGCP